MQMQIRFSLSAVLFCFIWFCLAYRYRIQVCDGSQPRAGAGISLSTRLLLRQLCRLSSAWNPLSVSSRVLVNVTAQPHPTSLPANFVSFAAHLLPLLLSVPCPLKSPIFCDPSPLAIARFSSLLPYYHGCRPDTASERPCGFRYVHASRILLTHTRLYPQPYPLLIYTLW